MRPDIISHALKGYRAGTRWMARCPAHHDRDPSLSISIGQDGRILVHCHAGCAQEAIIAALRSRGLWESARCGLNSAIPQNTTTIRSDHHALERTEAALRLWQSALPADETLVEAYLVLRGLHIPPPKSLRFHGALKHPAGGMWPAMVALVTRGGKPVAIHRTFLARNGSGKAPVDPVKMMLGPCHRGAVQLGPARNPLMVGEGIETCISAMQATCLPAWAALSTAGLRALDLPREVRDVIVLADGDDPGETAAQDCAWRWKREGRRVRIARPPRGMDFNDLLLRQAHRTEEAGQ